MNFRELLNVAEYNAEESGGYELPSKPLNKKPAKPGVQSEGVRRFLEKKKAEEIMKAEEARKQREKLLALRAQNTKSNKKAKIMASRTKDNDFSRIKLTEDEIEAKKKIEMELTKKRLADKVERMKIRIEMEEKEKLQPRKRKRKSKLNNGVDEEHHSDEPEEDPRISKEPEKKSRPRPPPIPSYSELLKLAEMKKNEPIVIPKKKKEERLLTKKERRLYMEEIEREKRKRERLEKGASLSDYKIPTANKLSSVSDKRSIPEKATVKKPVVIHIEKNSAAEDSSKLKSSKPVAPSDKKIITKTVDKGKIHVNNLPKTTVPPKPYTNHNREVLTKNITPAEKNHSKPSYKDDTSFLTKRPLTERPDVKKKKVKIAPVTPVVAPAPAAPPVPQLDTAALAAAIAKQVKEDLEKQIEAKYAAKFASMIQNSNDSKPKELEKLKSTNIPNKAHSSVNGTVPQKSHNKPLVSKKDHERTINSKPIAKVKKPSPPPPPPKKSFHPNPYLDPPRRRLEPIRPQNSVTGKSQGAHCLQKIQWPKEPLPKRRIESDDEDDDDDMSDFIDDGPTQNDENYSDYIKEIFGYDKNKYNRIDDDDIVESSFAEQLKEETRSARLGFLEDLEEERKNKELEKKWKMKQKHKK